MCVGSCDLYGCRCLCGCINMSGLVFLGVCGFVLRMLVSVFVWIC
jgi:hypothetical protein